VTNDSKPRLLDSERLAQTVVEYANYRSRETRVRLRVHRDGEDEDAQLKIVILKESAVPVPQTMAGMAQKWALRLNISATLAARNGRVMWRQENRNRDLATTITAADEAEFLQKLSHPWVYGALSYPLVKSMFYGESQ
jgi:outer membrane lipopolysaccharide assembly protein LptE/RlpB